MTTRKRVLICQDLEEFILSNDNCMLTDACKIRILNQFLNRFRMEFDTDLEFEETLESVIDLFKIQH
jgi:hypothetical protein